MCGFFFIFLCVFLCCPAVVGTTVTCSRISATLFSPTLFLCRSASSIIGVLAILE